MYQALRLGVPMVAVPMQKEQELNSLVAKRNGFSITVRLRHAATSSLPKALDRVVNDVCMRESAQRFAKRLEGVNGAVVAADQLEWLAERAEPAGARLCSPP